MDRPRWICFIILRLQQKLMVGEDMRNLILLLVVVAIGYGAYSYLGEDDNPFIGSWKSNRELTMQKLPTQFNAQQRQMLSSILGKMTIEVSEDKWRSSLDGQTDEGTYKILSSKDNCYQMEFNSKENGSYQSRICMVDGNMHYDVESVLGMVEVFSPN